MNDRYAKSSDKANAYRSGVHEYPYDAWVARYGEDDAGLRYRLARLRWQHIVGHKRRWRLELLVAIAPFVVLAISAIGLSLSPDKRHSDWIFWTGGSLLICVLWLLAPVAFGFGVEAHRSWRLYRESLEEYIVLHGLDPRAHPPAESTWDFTGRHGLTRITDMDGRLH